MNGGHGGKYIVGGGVAGLAAALAMAPEPVVLLTEATLDRGAASLWSQGGIAAAIGADDSVALHAADTIAAGDGLCDAGAVTRIIGAGPEVIAALRMLGVEFDDGMALEAAHSRRRIVHRRDSTGLAVTTALARAVRGAPHVRLIEGTRVLRLHVAEGRVAGVWVARRAQPEFLSADAVLIATGGAGALYRHTSNPDGATGSGLALAARAGAVLRDLEFVQFHPTGLDAGAAPMPLISEAVRGEGAVLVDETGARFTDDLAPRDAVSRAVFRHLAEGHRVLLDATRLGARFAVRFPAIDAACRAAGIDAAIQPIPVRPVAHYHMGGVATDADGRTSIDGLFAAGEAACTGLHGANRLASNSLLEAYVVGAAAGRAMAERPRRLAAAPSSPPAMGTDVTIGLVRDAVSRHLGVLRDGSGLVTLIETVLPHAVTADSALVALMMAVAAFRRRESRGGHARADFPRRVDAARHSEFTMAEALEAAAAVPVRHAA